MSDPPIIQVRQDADGRWDWRVLTPEGERIAEALKHIGHDQRLYRRKSAVKHARRVARGWQRQQAAQWQEVGIDDE